MDSDKTLVKEAQKDIKKFDNIYSSYFKKIYNYLRPKVSNDEFTADDLTSQTFEKAIKNINRFQWQGVSFSAWLYKIANNTLIDFYRKTKNEVNIDDKFLHNLKDEGLLLEDSVVESDNKHRIKEILNDLPERERVIVILKFYEGMSNKEIAEKMNMSETNVGTILHRSVQKLREIMQNTKL